MVVFHGDFPWYKPEKIEKNNDSEKILVKMVVDTTFRGISPQIMIERTRIRFFTPAMHTMVLHPKRNILRTCFHRDGKRPFDQ